MKKLSKKQIIIIIIAVIVLISLAITGVVLVINGSKNKETAKDNEKIESVQKDEIDEEEKVKDNEEEVDETVAVEDESKEETATEQETQTPAVEQPEQETQQQTSTNTNQNQNPNNSNTNAGSSTGNSGGNTTPTQPSTPTPTPTPEPEESPYAGMYSVLDNASKERFLKCADILRSGLVGQTNMKQYDTRIQYFGERIVILNNTTVGAWMYIQIANWSTDAEYVIGYETEPILREFPVLMKQCLEAIAPQGGTELYNTVNSLIMQYNGPYNVPTQGKISESIPGLSVTLNQGKSGLEIFFWAE